MSRVQDSGVYIIQMSMMNIALFPGLPTFFSVMWEKSGKPGWFYDVMMTYWTLFKASTYSLTQQKIHTKYKDSVTTYVVNSETIMQLFRGIPKSALLLALDPGDELVV